MGNRGAQSLMWQPNVEEQEMRRTDVYSQPLYYEIAFDFTDLKKQVDLFERFIRRYSQIQVKRFLDIGCGPGLQPREIVQRGYQAVGLDRSSRMLQYLKQKVEETGHTIDTVKADMMNFRLKQKVDFAFIMMGTISYVASNEDMLSHLNAVARCLKRGGLYLIENFRLDWSSGELFGEGSWMMERDGISVKTTYGVKLKDAITQQLTETMILRVNDHGRKLVLKEVGPTKLIFPQELLTLIELNGCFEFLGWFERFKMKRLRKPSMDNITLLRRK